LLPACGGARGYAAYLVLDASTDDGSLDDAGTDVGGGDDAGGGGGGCVTSSCKCLAGVASCTDAGSCQCCALGICLP